MSAQKKSKSGDEPVYFPAGTYDLSLGAWKLDCKYEKPTTSGLSRQQNCSQLVFVNCSYEKPTATKVAGDQRKAA